MSEGHVQLELVRKLMSLPADRREWSPDDWKLLRNRKAFISVESGQETSETVSQWNGLCHQGHGAEHREKPRLYG